MQDTQEAPNQKSTMAPLTVLKVLRPRQWTKNLIAFAPLLFAGRLEDKDALTATALCCASLCMVSGSIYVINDIKDRESDAKHPTKKKRPIAAGKVSVPVASAIAVVSLLGGLTLGFIIRPVVCGILLAYVLLQVLYNLVLKRHAILDIMSIATGFVLRALAGGAAAHVVLSGWFLICTSLGALFLAIEKRRQELIVLGAGADSVRKSLDKYSLELINRMESLIVPSIVTSYCIYCFFSPSGQWMLITAPFVVYGIMRYQLLSTFRQSTETPEEVLLKDKAIQVCILLWVVVSIVVVHGYLPNFVSELVRVVDSLSIFRR